MKSLVVLFALIILIFSVPSYSQDTISDADQASMNEMDALLQERDSNSLSQRDDQAQNRMNDARSTQNTGFFNRVFGGDEDLRIQQLDSEMGIRLGTFSTSEDRSKIGLAYTLNSDLKDLTELSGFEASYSYRLQKTWLDFFVARTTAQFDQITENNPALGALTPAANSDEVEPSTSLLNFGAGLMYRTTYIQNLIGGEGFFETIAAHVTYNQFDDSFREESFSGLGFKADFGIHRRFSKNFHFGGRMTYQMATVKIPAAFEGETSSSRSLLLRWLGLGVDIGFYF